MLQDNGIGKGTTEQKYYKGLYGSRKIIQRSKKEEYTKYHQNQTEVYIIGCYIQDANHQL